MIATDVTYPYSAVEKFLEEMYLCQNIKVKQEFISILKKMVPEFIDENQEY
jgi:hypothetical protein